MVIGNDNYAEAPLRNAVNDANAMEAALTDAAVGFKVNKTLNANRDKFIEDFGNFVRGIQPGDTVLLYYAGHAMQIDGLNYLIPIGFWAGTPFEAKNKAISLNDLLEEIDTAQARATILVLDACQTNPYSGMRGSTGLHSVEAARGTFIAFAAQPDHPASDNPVGGHGLFTSALLEELKVPGLSIDSVFNRTRQKVDDESHHDQVPFTNSGLLGDFFFRPAPQMPDMGEFVSELSQIQQLGQRMKEALDAHQPDAAILLGKEAVNQCQATRGKLQSLTPAQRKDFVAIFEGIYRTLAETLVSRGRLPESSAVLALLKDEVTFDLLPTDQKNKEPSALALTQAEQQAQDEYQKSTAQVVSLGAQWAELKKVASRTPEQEKQFQQLSEQLSAATKGLNDYYSRLYVQLGKNGAANQQVAEVKDSVGLLKGSIAKMPHTVALYTILGDDRYSVIVIAGPMALAREQSISKHDLARKIVDFRQVLRDPAADPKPKAKELYDILIGPIKADLDQAQAQTLVWSLDGVLRYVPLAALYDGQSYMAEKYKQTLLPPSAMGLVTDHEARSPRTVIFGVTKAWGEFPLNPSVGTETKAVEDITGGRLFLDGAFTRKSFESELSTGDYSLVHLATHLMLNPGDIADSYMLLGDGSQMTLDEMRNNQNISFSGVDLLVMSGSSTALGAGADGREIDGFNTVAHLKGARSVLASLWDVDDASTGVFMTQFYQNVKGGVSKAEALRKAQLSMLADSRYAHPFFWAPFVLSGDWR